MTLETSACSWSLLYFRLIKLLVLSVIRHEDYEYVFVVQNEVQPITSCFCLEISSVIK